MSLSFYSVPTVFKSTSVNRWVLWGYLQMCVWWATFRCMDDWGPIAHPSTGKHCWRLPHWSSWHIPQGSRRSPLASNSVLLIWTERPPGSCEFPEPPFPLRANVSPTEETATQGRLNKSWLKDGYHLEHTDAQDKTIKEAGEQARLLLALAALPEDPGLIP